jgi:hypothetical protein
MRGDGGPANAMNVTNETNDMSHPATHERVPDSIGARAVKRSSVQRVRKYVRYGEYILPPCRSRFRGRRSRCCCDSRILDMATSVLCRSRSMEEGRPNG